MLFKNKKSILIIMILFIMSFVSAVLYANCDFMAMLAKKDSKISQFNEADYFFQFQKDRSNPNHQEDGYGVIYYKNNDFTIPLNQTFFLIGEHNHSWYQHHGPSGQTVFPEPEFPGYYWNDSKHPNGPEYTWIDISESNTQVTFPTNDISTDLIPIGFPFTYYGNVYTEFRISPNGWIGFGADNPEYDNSSIPISTAPRPAIFGFWDDLNPENDSPSGVPGGNVYYQTNTERLVVWFDDVVEWSSSNPNEMYNFQIILSNNGDIKIQYQTVSGVTNSGTIGIQNTDGDEGLQVVCDSNYIEDDSYIENELAVLISTDVYPEPLDAAQADIMSTDNEAVIVLGHDRNRGETAQDATGQHPYRFELNDKTYIFQHNGSQHAKQQMKNYCQSIDPDWFEIYPLNWESLGNDIEFIDTVGDTELLFHYIMSHVIEYDGYIISALINALNEADLDGYDFRQALLDVDDRVNIVLSDGESLYIFRNTALSGSSYNISYKDYENRFIGVKTQSTIPGGTQVQQYSLVKIPRDGEIVTYENIFNENIYVNGTISGNTTWTEDHYVIGDLIIEDGSTLTIEDGANIYFTGKHNVEVYGELKLNEGAGLHLSNHSAVIIDGAEAQLTLSWGTFVSGYEEKLRCDCCPGDRIIAQNGGVIQAGDYATFNNQTEIKIYSRSSKKWNGFKIDASVEGSLGRSSSTINGILCS